MAGIDVHKEMLAITVLMDELEGEPKEYQFESSAFTDDLMAIALKLKEMLVTDVAIKSSEIYWKPVFNVFEPLGLKGVVADADHIKNVPGRKTDMNDSRWIAELHRLGLIRASFISDGEFQRM